MKNEFKKLFIFGLFIIATKSMFGQGCLTIHTTNNSGCTVYAEAFGGGLSAGVKQVNGTNYYIPVGGTWVLDEVKIWDGNCTYTISIPSFPGNANGIWCASLACVSTPPSAPAYNVVWSEVPCSGSPGLIGYEMHIFFN